MRSNMVGMVLLLGVTSEHLLFAEKRATVSEERAARTKAVFRTESEPVDVAGETIVVVSKRDHPILSHGFRSVVKIDAHAGETTSIAEMLAHSVGVRVRSLGGLGGFASLSIRGASPSHTAVWVDGVPLSRIASAAQDLGELALGSFSELAVYRGAVPAELGGAALGGALRCTTQLGPDSRGRIAKVAMGWGSFGARHLRGRVHEQALAGRLRFHAGLGYRGANGDYKYFNDKGTFLVPDDDSFTVRTNNGFNQAYGVLRARYHWRKMSLELGSRTNWKNQEIASLAAVEMNRASLLSFSQLFDGRFESALNGQGARLSGQVFGLLERQHYRNPSAAVGLGTQDNRYWTRSLGSRGWVRYHWGSRHDFSLAADGRLEAHEITYLLGNERQRPQGTRFSTGASLSDEIALTRRLEVVPAFRIDYQKTLPGRGWRPLVVEPDAQLSSSRAFLSPRMTARWLLADVVVKASMGRYFRAPTLSELYGDRGFIVGNPRLKPETGLNLDLGMVLAPTEPFGVVDNAFLQLALFAARPKSAIVLLPSAGRRALAQNLGDATIYGLEAALALRFGKLLTLTVNYTYLDSRQDSPFLSYDGKRLPLRPRHETYGKVEASLRQWEYELIPWSDLTFTSGNFLDAANLQEVPRRLFVGLGLKVRLGANFLAGVEAKNLTNRRTESIGLDPPPTPSLRAAPRAVADFLGYPLPGRAFYLTSEVSF